MDPIMSQISGVFKTITTPVSLVNIVASTTCATESTATKAIVESSAFTFQLIEDTFK